MRALLGFLLLFFGFLACIAAVRSGQISEAQRRNVDALRRAGL